MIQLRKFASKLWLRFPQLVLGTTIFLVPLSINLGTKDPTITFKYLLLYSLVSTLLVWGVIEFCFFRKIKQIDPLVVVIYCLSLYIFWQIWQAPVFTYRLNQGSAFFALFGLFWFVYHFFRSYKAHKKIMWLLLGSTLIVILYGFLQYKNMDFIPWESVSGRKRIISSLGNNTYLAEYITVVFFITIGLIYHYRKSTVRWVLFAFLPFELTLIVLTQSRNSLIAIVFIFFIGTILSYKKIIKLFKYRSLVVMVCILILIFIVLWFMPNSFLSYNWTKLMDRFGSGLILSDSSIQNRLVLWKTTISLWNQNPWTGIGTGQFQIKFIDELSTILNKSESVIWQIVTSSMEEIQADESHNDYLQCLAEWGILGYGLWLIFLSIIAIRAIGIIRGTLLKDNPDHRALFVGVCLGWFTFLLVMFFAFPLRLPASGMLFFMLCGMIGGVASPYENLIRENPTPLSYIYRIPVAISLLGIVIWWWGIMGTQYQADIYTFRAELFFKEGKYKECEDLAYRSSKLYPGNGDNWFILGNLYADSSYYRRANEMYDKAYLSMNNPSLWINKGLLALKMLRYGEAEMIWRKISQINSGYMGIRHLHGMLYYYQGKFSDAREEFYKEIRTFPDNVEARLYYAEVEIKLGNYEKAIENLNLIVRKYNKYHRGAWERLGYAYSQINEYKKAVEAYEKSKEIYLAFGEKQEAFRIDREIKKCKDLLIN